MSPAREITGEVAVSATLLSNLAKEVRGIQDIQTQLPSWESKDTTSLVASLLGAGSLLNASDLHLEAVEEGSKLRARIDGMLHDAALVSQKTSDALLSRIKLLSGIKLNVSDRPQDGRFTIVFKETSLVEVRVSSLPSEHGESLVLRILNPQNLKTIEDLELRKDLLPLFEKEITKPNGMILVTGPTGSGKTTTLYAFLRAVHRPEIKIITIEDPIEYHLQGVSQTQVKPGKEYTFALGLRAIVRQDPDVILVGEIRDRETAEIALQAALTGHLVFSTLHTNDAVGTVSRLLSLGADAANIAPALNLIIAQRLVRKVCKECGKKRNATKEEQKTIELGLKGLPKDVAGELPQVFEVVEPVGCKACNNTGYMGRVGIFEAIALEEAMEAFIAKAPSITELREETKKAGMVTMYQDGLLKVVKQTTTLQEVERVTAE